MIRSSLSPHFTPTSRFSDLLVWPSLQDEMAPFLKYCRGLVLNAGSGPREIQLGTRDLNVDIVPTNRPHLIGDLHRIPLHDESVDTVVSIAVLEHVSYPWIVACEFYRVLRPAGHGVICVPFLQPQHACPSDFVRFTQEGLSTLMKYAGFEVIETAHVHHFGQTMAWLLSEYLEYNHPHKYMAPLWAVLLKQLSQGTLLGGDSPNTHNTHYVVVRKPGQESAANPRYLEALASNDPHSWFVPLLRCPHTRQPLRLSGDSLVTEDGAFAYGFIDGIPDLRPKLNGPDTNLRQVDALALSAVERPNTNQAQSLAGSASIQHKPVLTIASEKTFEVSFKTAYLRRLQQTQPSKVAVLVTNEFEGIFRNGGIGTYYRRLAEQLTAEGWHVLLLLTWTEEGFGGESELPAVKHIFSTFEIEQVLNLQPVHLRMLSVRTQNTYTYQSVCCFFFTQAILNCFPASHVYIEFPDIMGMGYHSIHAKQAGFLGITASRRSRCTGVTSGYMKRVRSMKRSIPRHGFGRRPIMIASALRTPI